MQLTQSRLKELLQYLPETGKFIWKFSTRKDLIGKEAGYVRGDGYRLIKLDGTMFYAHRLVCLYVNGKFPEISWDHIDRVRDNNRLENFRDSNAEGQQHNKGKNINNTTGIKGISIVRQKGYCGVRASVRYNKKTYYKQIALSGKCKENVIEELTCWLQDKRNQLHGEFTNHG